MFNLIKKSCMYLLNWINFHRPLFLRPKFFLDLFIHSKYIIIKDPKSRITLPENI